MDMQNGKWKMYKVSKRQIEYETVRHSMWYDDNNNNGMSDALTVRNLPNIIIIKYDGQ